MKIGLALGQHCGSKAYLGVAFAMGTTFTSRILQRVSAEYVAQMHTNRHHDEYTVAT